MYIVKDKSGNELQIMESSVSVVGKNYAIWEVKAEHILSFYLNDRNESMQLEVDVLGAKDSYDVAFNTAEYEEVRLLFLDKLQGVKPKSLSLMHQIIVPAGLVLLLSVLVGMAWWFMRQAEVTAETMEQNGKGSIVSKAMKEITERFGSEWILIGGGAVVVLCVLWLLKVMMVSRKGVMIDFQKGPGKLEF